MTFPQLKQRTGSMIDESVTIFRAIIKKKIKIKIKQKKYCLLFLCNKHISNEKLSGKSWSW
jgi:hypothetical protein